MTFLQFSQYLEQLEKTSSRLILIDILADLFSKAERGEVAKVSYLLQSRIAPFYEATEIGMAQMNVAASIARAYDVEKSEVLKEYGQKGDLGIVAHNLSQGTGKHTVSEVFEKLTEIANFKGEGTVEKKIGVLSDLLKKSSPLEAKHLSRIPIGASRLESGTLQF